VRNGEAAGVSERIGTLRGAVSRQMSAGSAGSSSACVWFALAASSWCCSRPAPTRTRRSRGCASTVSGSRSPCPGASAYSGKRQQRRRLRVQRHVHPGRPPLQRGHTGKHLLTSPSNGPGGHRPCRPGLLSTAAMVATERPSWTVFILPGGLLALLALLVGVVLPRTATGRQSVTSGWVVGLP